MIQFLPVVLPRSCCKWARLLYLSPSSCVSLWSIEQMNPLSCPHTTFCPKRAINDGFCCFPPHLFLIKAMAPRERLERLPDRREPETAELEEIHEDTISTVSSSASDWLREELRTFFLEIADALQTPREECSQELNGLENLSILTLQKDLKRCYSLLHPILEVAAAFYDIFMWRDAFSTLLFALVFFYSLFRQWTAILILLLLLLQFSLNFLTAHKGIDVGWYFLPRKSLPKPKFDLNGAQLVLEVAKYVQALLRFTVNVLEKFHSLFTWKRKEITLRFYLLLAYWLAWAVLFDLGTCISWCLAAFGVRLFLTTYLFDRFPRLRRSLDTYGFFYSNLPVKSDRISSFSTAEDSSSSRVQSSSTQSINSMRNVKSKSRFRLWTQGKQFLRRPRCG